MSNPFVGEIRIFGGNFAPRGWAFCNGQLMPIAQNTALFSLLGTNYGGNGTTTFALPNLQGRFPMHQGQGPGLTPRFVGEQGGESAVTLDSTQVPPHTHTMQGVNAAGNQQSPAGHVGAEIRGTLYAPSPDGTTMSPAALAPAGGGQPHNNMSPYLTLTFIIALQGVFPPRS